MERLEHTDLSRRLSAAPPRVSSLLSSREGRRKTRIPAFQGARRYQCIELAEVTPGMVKGNRIKVKGLPVIRIRSSRPLPDSNQLKALRLVMHGRILAVDLVYAEQANPLPPNADAVGIDMGVNERMTLSDGSTVERRVVDRKRERRLQRAISRRKQGQRWQTQGGRGLCTGKTPQRNLQPQCLSPHHNRSGTAIRPYCHRGFADTQHDGGGWLLQEGIESGSSGANVGRDSTTTGVQGRVGRSAVGRSQSRIYVPDLLRVWLCQRQGQSVSDICMFRVRPCSG